MKKLLIIPLLFLAVNALALPQLPDVAPDRALTVLEQAELKSNLRGLIHKELIPARNDYVDDLDRGTVEFNPEKGNRFGGKDVLKARNYSYHKVIIPNGTIIKGVNFSQKNPHTDAINGKNLHFINCNLNNVELDNSWTFEGGLRIHSKHETEIVGERIFDVYYVEKNGVFEEVEREEIIAE
jgi:hypothetical protein